MENGGPIRKEQEGKKVVVRYGWFKSYVVLFSGGFILALTAGVLARICYETFKWGWSLMGWA
jgi:hypothetical protein